MILAVAALNAPWVGITLNATRTAHRVTMDGLPMATWETAEHVTAVCGQQVKLTELRWADLRTRGTQVTRCTGCNPRTKATTP